MMLRFLITLIIMMKRAKNRKDNNTDLMPRSLYNRLAYISSGGKIRLISAILLIMYLLLLIFLTLFSRGCMRDSFYQSKNLIPFRTIFLYMNANINNDIIVINLLGNIAAFMPMGFLLPLVWRKTDRFGGMTIASLGVSLVIEVMQYIMVVGAADIDDLILNTAGGILGLLLLRICRLICMKICQSRWVR